MVLILWMALPVILGVFIGAWLTAKRMIKEFAEIPQYHGSSLAAGKEGRTPSKEPETTAGWAYEPERPHIRSPYGHMLSCELFHCEGARKGVVLCHDAGSSKEALRAYVQMFLERGITVLTYDQCAHGESGGNFCSYGYYERDDARECVNFLENTLGNDAGVGLWGIGMGAAAAIELAKRDTRIRFAILDSVYAELTPLLAGKFQTGVRKRIVKYMLPFLDWVNRHSYGWRYSDLSPMRSVSKTSLPLLLIHGAADPLIGAENAYRFVLERKDAELVIFPKAGHGGSRASNPAEYRRVVQQFLIGADF